MEGTSVLTGASETGETRSLDVTRLVFGALTGAALGGLMTVVLLAAAIFVAVENERPSDVAGVVAVDYVAGDEGGFELDVATGSGVLVLLAGGAALGALSVVGSGRLGGKKSAR